MITNRAKLFQTADLLARAAILAWFLPRSTALFQNFLPGMPLLKRLPDAPEGGYWLTIDDGPCRHDTEAILRVLEAHSARASFFAIGKQIERHPELARAMIEAGHTVENHTWSHPSATLWLRPQTQIRTEIRRCIVAQQSNTGTSPRFFRAPAGRWNPAICRAALSEGLIPAGWSARTRDTLPCCDLLAAIPPLAARIQAGDIVLMHQGGGRGRAAALELFLLGTERRGLHPIAPPEIVLQTPNQTSLR